MASLPLGVLCLPIASRGRRAWGSVCSEDTRRRRARPFGARKTAVCGRLIVEGLRAPVEGQRRW